MKLLFFILCGVAAFAGTNTLISVSGGQVKPTHVNQFGTALKGNVLPRSASGIPTTKVSNLGSATKEWLELNVISGGFHAGDIKIHHTYNGTFQCGQGWMLMNGDQVTEAAYDTQHTAGDWDSYIVSSPLADKYLPNMASKYPIGSATTTQTGTKAITSVGNAGNVLDFSHSHTGAGGHVHQWFHGITGASGQTYNSAGSAIDWPDSTKDNFAGQGDADSGYALADENQYYTEALNPGTSTDGNSKLSVQPASIAVQYCMRIID